MVTEGETPVEAYVRRYLESRNAGGSSWRALADELGFSYVHLFKVAKGEAGVGRDLEEAIARKLHDGSIDALRAAATDQQDNASERFDELREKLAENELSKAALGKLEPEIRATVQREAWHLLDGGTASEARGFAVLVLSAGGPWAEPSGAALRADDATVVAHVRPIAAAVISILGNRPAHVPKRERMAARRKPAKTSGKGK